MFNCQAYILHIGIDIKPTHGTTNALGTLTQTWGTSLCLYRQGTPLSVVLYSYFVLPRGVRGGGWGSLLPFMLSYQQHIYNHKYTFLQQTRQVVQSYSLLESKIVEYASCLTSKCLPKKRVIEAKQVVGCINPGPNHLLFRGISGWICIILLISVVSVCAIMRLSCKDFQGELYSYTSNLSAIQL